MTTPTKDWTQGYRDAWYYFRSGVSWLFMGWALRVMPEDDPNRVRFARAMLPIAKTASYERRPDAILSPSQSDGYWWATVQLGDPDAPPCLWGRHRTEAEEGRDSDETVVRVHLELGSQPSVPNGGDSGRSEARPATDEEVQASAKRMLDKHRPSLEKLAEHDGPWRRILREELANLRPDVARFKLRRFVAYTRALLDEVDRAEPAGPQDGLDAAQIKALVQKWRADAGSWEPGIGSGMEMCADEIEAEL